MRTGKTTVLLTCVIALTSLFSKVASADDPIQDVSTDPRKAAIPNGLNSAINVPSAALAIDDKSPMAFNIGQGNSVANFVSAKIRTKAGMFPLPHGPVLRLDNVLLLDTSSRDAFLNSVEHLLLSKDFVQRLTNNGVQLSYDTEQIMKLKLHGLGRLILNQLALRDLIARFYPNQSTKPFDFTTQELKEFHQVIFPDKPAKGSPPNAPPTSVIYLGFQTRAGGGPTVYTPEAIYSNGRSGVDLAIQPYLSNEDGIGAALRLDLSPGRHKLVESIVPLVDNFNDYSEIYDSAKDLSVDTPEGRIELLRLMASILDNYDPAGLAVARASLSLRVSAQFGYRYIEQTGKFYTTGLSVSQLVPVKIGKRNTGITTLLGVQALHFASQEQTGVTVPGQPMTTVLRTGIALIWQDRISHVVHESFLVDEPKDKGKQNAPAGIDVADIKRWGTQIGVEANVRNGLQKHDTVGVFWRERLPRFTEFTLSLGTGANGRGYVGFSLGKTFSLY
jgi:hypothetical protein